MMELLDTKRRVFRDRGSLTKRFLKACTKLLFPSCGTEEGFLSKVWVMIARWGWAWGWLGSEVTDGGQGVLMEESAEVAIYSARQAGAFVDQGGVYLNRVGATLQCLDHVIGVGDAATGVDGHGLADLGSYVGYDAEGVGEERFAAEAATSHLDGGLLHGAGVGGGDAVDAQLAGDADEGQDVFLLRGIVVGRNFDEEGSGAVAVDAFEKLPEGGEFVEHAEAGGVGGADVELYSPCEGSGSQVALAEFVYGEARDAEDKRGGGLFP